MGLYIADMTLPPKGECEIVVISSDGSVRRRHGTSDLSWNAINAQEPYGDLISRNALIETIDGIWDCNDLRFQPNDKICDPNDCKGCKWRETMDCFRRMVKHAPTVIPSSEEAET